MQGTALLLRIRDAFPDNYDFFQGEDVVVDDAEWIQCKLALMEEERDRLCVSVRVVASNNMQDNVYFGSSHGAAHGEQRLELHVRVNDVVFPRAGGTQCDRAKLRV